MNATDDTIRIRYAGAADLPAIYEYYARAVGISAEPQDVDAWTPRVKLEDILVAEDISDAQQPLVVGASLVYRMRLTVPGGARINAAWLAKVTVATTHQGHGIWRQISAQGFGILMQRGYPILCGAPLQPALFDVLGGGVATYARTYTIDPRVAKLRVPPDRNRARQLNAAQAGPMLPEIYDRWCAGTPGALSRDNTWWADFLQDRVTQRDGGSELIFIVHPDGFVAYRVIGGSPHTFRPPFGTLVVYDFCAVTDDAHTELFAALLGLTMFDGIQVELPVDDPLPLKLSSQIAAETTSLNDFLSIRIMNVPEVLGMRTYSADADIVLDVTDPLNVAGGRFLLKTRGGVGTCEPHDGSPDVSVSLVDLATIYMGAHRATELHRAGRVVELQSEALDSLDAVFRTDRAPYCGTLF